MQYLCYPLKYVVVFLVVYVDVCRQPGRIGCLIWDDRGTGSVAIHVYNNAASLQY
jgi:hypothetical protein